MEKQLLTFKVFNTRSTAPEKNIPKKKGIGVTNVKKQLALIYPNKHTYQVEELEDSYMVNLRIELKNLAPKINDEPKNKMSNSRR